MSGVYRALRPALFSLPPERAHALAMRASRAAASLPPLLRSLERASRRAPERVSTELFGVRFPNPLGVAAGLDKDADALPIWSAMGFGHVEIGTVTPRPQPGNPRPRVTRLVPDRAVVNAMGFPSVGADALAERLEAWRRRGAWPDAPVGVNLGKNKTTPLDRAADDYRAVAAAMAPYADFLVVNVSSPNTPGLRDLQDEARLRELVAAARDGAPDRPVLVKLAPDLTDAALVGIAEHAPAWGVRGLVVTNTTLSRAGLRVNPGAAGGLSGRPLAARSRHVLQLLRPATDLPLVSVGGIDGPAEALRRFEAGADLVQVYTALIYEGPRMAVRILDALIEELERRGLQHVRELRTSPGGA